MSSPVRLCAHILPAGNNCRQVTLRGQLFCRHHLNGSRIHRRPLHQRAMDRLRAEAKTLGTYDLLAHLSRHLNRIQSAVAGYPEARTLLLVVLDRIDELERSGHIVDPGKGIPAAYLADLDPNLQQMHDFLQTLNHQ